MPVIRLGINSILSSKYSCGTEYDVCIQLLYLILGVFGVQTKLEYN